jgi:purine nucleosidase/adenosylhomocysteine nucleosidase
MFGIVFATEAEALPFLDRGGFKDVALNPFRLLASPETAHRVIISGMGKVSAALATQWLIRENGPSRVVHAGICGALGDPRNFAPGEILRVSSASEGRPGPGIPAEAVACAGDLWSELRPATLVTVERPLFDDVRRAELLQYGELVDMEGAVVARVARLHGAPCSIIKGVSDHARDQDRSMLKSRLPAVSADIAMILWKELIRNASA